MYTREEHCAIWKRYRLNSRVKKVCLKCKKTYMTNHRHSKYCSRSCSGLSHKKENHWNWKGGKSLRKDGYVLILSPNHPFANRGRIFEHRAIIENKLGRILKPKEIVHHLNGIKNDNRPKNLVLCSNKTHHLFIKQLQIRILELENLIKSWEVINIEDI